MMSAAVCGVLHRNAVIRMAPRVLGVSNTQQWTETRTLIRSFATVREEKLAKKKKRTELYEASQARMQKLQTRREGKDVGGRKKKFREWYDKRRIYLEIMDRKARQANMEWTIQAAAVLERLPVVTPDKPQWEIDYYNLLSYLQQFGKEYPQEIGFSPGKGPILMTDEEILGALLDRYSTVIVFLCFKCIRLTSLPFNFPIIFQRNAAEGFYSSTPRDGSR